MINCLEQGIVETRLVKCYPGSDHDIISLLMRHKGLMDLAPFMTVVSISGGCHFYFSGPVQVPLRSDKQVLIGYLCILFMVKQQCKMLHLLSSFKLGRHT